MNFLDWDTRRGLCCAAIAGCRSTLKILLKTKNDPYFLERWIVHHLRIAGDGNIVVFDNMSDNAEVLALYRRYQSVITAIRFRGFHNDVHQVRKFADLYRSLAKSCDYFLFLDTDELLVLFDGDRHHSDAHLLDFIKANGAAEVFPTTWLYNCGRHATRFTCGTELHDLATGATWGKPVLRSTARLWGITHHNDSIDPKLYASPFRTSFFLLHMTNLIPEQRLSANINKLVARGFARAGDTVEQICARSLDGISDKLIPLYVDEIKSLASKTADAVPQHTELQPGCLELREDGRIQYFGKKERDVIQRLMREPETSFNRLMALTAMLQPPPTLKERARARARRVYRSLAQPPNLGG
jgi:hypothetical protein